MVLRSMPVRCRRSGPLCFLMMTSAPAEAVTCDMLSYGITCSRHVERQLRSKKAQPSNSSGQCGALLHKVYKWQRVFSKTAPNYSWLQSYCVGLPCALSRQCQRPALKCRGTAGRTGFCASGRCAARLPCHTPQHFSRI